MLNAYFDRSGQDDSAFLTLSGIAATEELWSEIAQTWNYILQSGDRKASYMHMIEAVHLRGEFSKEKGWNDESVFELVNALLSYITQIDKSRYCQFACTIDMNAYRRLEKETYQLGSPIDLCNLTCVETVMQWYLLEYKGGLDLEAKYYFDQGEPFEPVFREKWERETEKDRSAGQYNTIWSHIKHVGSADMRSTPGLQIADMLAWARNREENKATRFEGLALALTRLAPSKWIIWNEESFRKKYRPLIHPPYTLRQPSY